MQIHTFMLLNMRTQKYYTYRIEVVAHINFSKKLYRCGGHENAGHVLTVLICFSKLEIVLNYLYDFRSHIPASASALSGLSERSEKIQEEW